MPVTAPALNITGENIKRSWKEVALGNQEGTTQSISQLKSDLQGVITVNLCCGNYGWKMKGSFNAIEGEHGLVATPKEDKEESRQNHRVVRKINAPLEKVTGRQTVGDSPGGEKYSYTTYAAKVTSKSAPSEVYKGVKHRLNQKTRHAKVSESTKKNLQFILLKNNSEKESMQKV